MEINARIKNPITGKEENGIVEDKVQLALITKALSGDVAAIKEINDTLYGKIQDKIDHTTGGEKFNNAEITVTSDENAKKLKAFLNGKVE